MKVKNLEKTKNRFGLGIGKNIKFNKENIDPTATTVKERSSFVPLTISQNVCKDNEHLNACISCHSVFEERIKIYFTPESVYDKNYRHIAEKIFEQAKELVITCYEAEKKRNEIFLQNLIESYNQVEVPKDPQT